MELAWVNELKDRYKSGENVIFLLHGNVNDLFPVENTKTAKYEFCPLTEYLQRMLKDKKDLIVDFNLSEGFQLYATDDSAPWMDKKLVALNAIGPSIYRSFQEIEKLIQDNTRDVGVLINYCETLLPDQSINSMSEQDRSTLVKVLQWTKDPELSASNNIIILSTEHLTMVHRRFLASSQVALINISLPSTEVVSHFVSEYKRDHSDISFAMGEQRFAEMCSGLTLLQVQGILKRAQQAEVEIDFALINDRKKGIVEQECQGLVEFVAPKHDFSHVGGADGLKEELLRIAAAIKKGRRSQVPMGMLFVGPMGTGKTYIAEAFAGESGLTCIKLKNFREKWVGSTESNFEKILQLIKALGNVLLIIDEADRSLSAGGGDGGVDSRVIAKLKEFMSDTTHRGRIVVVMMTNRPDKIDIDLKRPGRLDSKIPFFLPDDVETCLAILKAQVRKHKVVVEDDVNWDNVKVGLKGYSAAEIEAVLLAAIRCAVQESDSDSPVLKTGHFTAAIGDVVPTRDFRMIEYMEMLAVFESSSRSMLPERYQNLDPKEIQETLDIMRGGMNGRV